MYVLESQDTIFYINYQTKLDTLLACSDPPEGFARWTLRLLADKLVELQMVEDISAEGVRQILKKTPYVRIGGPTG